MSDHSNPSADRPQRKKSGPKPKHITPEQKREAARLAVAKYREKLKVKGLCVKCGQRRPPRSGRSICNVCLRAIRERRQQLLQQDMCICGKRKREKGRTLCTPCRKRQNGYDHKLYHGRKKARLCTECSNDAIPGKRLCLSCREKERAVRLALRLEAFNAYGGPKCTCCGTESLEFLTMEHPDKDGAKHRRLMGGKGGTGFYRRLKQLGFPQTPRMVVMCFNCNFARGCFGYCPCQKNRSTAESHRPC